uniref:Olfactory receptor n=1 Tax=Pyxicephalus adspersus TaxID=30357 RepID=A0AAV3A3B6_PYXAD|nr:TPA: hypothetical protein GDO54_014795 [Pyxicephalus adspersus]
MASLTILKEFTLSALSDLPALQFPLFLFFLVIYLLTLIWNLLIIVLIVTNSHLHVPMYFFLGNLASLDLCCSSVTVPRMLFDLLTRKRKITVTECLTQDFFFILFATSECFLLAVMSYDRYTAVCQPLHYIKIMSWKVCVQLVSLVLCLTFTYSLIHICYASKLTFCASDIIGSFFCDLPQLFKISCSDLLGGFLTSGSLILTFLPYIYILKAVLKMNDKRSKVFSTCSSHLTVVLMYYGSVFFNYFQPNAIYHYTGDKWVAVYYTAILPLLNPLIYSLRNQDFKTAFGKFLRKIMPNGK